MRKLHTRLLVVLVLSLHLGVSFSDLDHVDFLHTGAGMQETVTTHDCGPREIHGNLDSQHYCIPCFRNIAGVASLDVHTTVLPPSARLCPVKSARERSFAGFIPQTYHRGPPPHRSVS